MAARRPLPALDPNLLERGGYITTSELAVYLRRSAATLDRWAGIGYGPKFTKLGRDRLYEPADVKEWLQGKKREQEGRARESRGDAA